MNELKELSLIFSDLCSMLTSKVSSSENLGSIEDQLKHILSRCLASSPQSWPQESEGSAGDFYLNFFSACKEIYQLCLSVVRGTSAGSNESFKTILNVTYELQCFFVGAMPRCDALKNDLYKSCCATQLCLVLFEVSNITDKLDPRISLPLWKLVSSIMQQYKNELNKNHSANANVLGHDNSVECRSILDFMLVHLLDSVQHFMEGCLLATRVCDGTKSTSNTNLKMLNLLNRIATFCIREFSTTSLTCKDGVTGTGLVKWLQWMIKTRYCGGIYASGTGFPSTLVQTLESSAFLAIDVSLSHLVALPIDQNKEHSVSVAIFHYKNFIPAVKCRICGTLMAGLARQPQFYPRWFNDDFNLAEELFSACSQLKSKDLVDDSAGSDLLRTLCAITDEFYTTILTQICACVCGIPASCFTYLESALLSAVLSEHYWTSLLATDVWCFLARYGTGELCWQYATTFSEAIYRSVCRIFQASLITGGGDPEKLILSSLTRLGSLLARLIVFLTPKQQVEFLRTYPLSAVTAIPGEEPPRSVLWWFVPLEVERLQKIAQSIVQDCLTERISQSPCLSHSNDQSTVLLDNINATAMLYMADTMPSPWREANAMRLAQLSMFTVAQSQSLNDYNHLLPPCATWLVAAAKLPVSALMGHLTRWNQHLVSSALIPPSPLCQLIQWFLTTLSPDSELISPSASFLSFTVLRSCYFWVMCSESQLSVDKKGDFDRSTPSWIRQLCSLLRRIPIDSVDTFVCRPIVELLNQKLVGVQPCENVPNSLATTASTCVLGLENAFNLVEEKRKSLCSADFIVLKQLATRLNAIVNDVEHMEVI